MISPHLDDAVFSCGSLLAEREATIATICAGVPADSVEPHGFDREAGFESAAAAMHCRRREDKVAAQVVGARVQHFDCLEVMYSEDEPISDAVGTALGGANSGEPVLGPLGIRHPDHIAVTEAFRRIASSRKLNAWLYQELPYGVLWPVEMSAPTESRSCSVVKLEAIECYASQLHGMDRDALTAPEQYFRLAGSGVL